MVKDIVIPKLGMTMEKATVAQWLAQEGDWIEEKQAVVVIETEKVASEVEALDAGFLHILSEIGAVAMVGEPIGRLAETKEELASLQQAEPGPGGQTAPAADAGSPSAATPAATPAPAPDAKTDRVRISPAAKKMARDHNLDYSGLQGSGPGGRIKRADIEKALADRQKPAEAGAVRAPAPEPPRGEMLDGKAVKATLPLTGLRGAVADHMQRSLSQSAQLTTMGEFDVTELVRCYQSLKAKMTALGLRLTYTDILVLVLARALKQNPIINSSLVDNKIVLWEDVNIGLAVSLPWEEYDAGLIVPVLRNADRKTLPEISRELKELQTKATGGGLTMEDVTGGTFTLSNVGGFGRGYSFATPVLNQPQSAIIMTGAIVERPLIVEGQIQARSVMNWSFTFDHRVINGAPSGKFLSDLNDYLSNPYLLLL